MGIQNKHNVPFLKSASFKKRKKAMKRIKQIYKIFKKGNNIKKKNDAIWSLRWW